MVMDGPKISVLLQILVTSILAGSILLTTDDYSLKQWIYFLVT